MSVVDSREEIERGREAYARRAWAEAYESLSHADQTAGRSLSPAGEGEESPGSTAKRRRVTPAGGDPRDSATESKPPLSGAGRVKGWGKSPPGRW